MYLLNSINVEINKNNYIRLGKFKNDVYNKIRSCRLICIIFFVITIILLSKIQYLKSYSKKLETEFNKMKKINTKNKAKFQDKCTNNNLLQLYIENRTQFYIKGRQKIMRNVGAKYNDSNIVTFQDKLNWLLVHESPESKTNIVDKILLRKYSEKILGKDICVPIIKIYKDADEINLDELPDKFVLKCNHGSGMNLICNNKAKFNISKAKKILKNWMKVNYGLKMKEYQYMNVKKKIFAETFLKDNLTDYKFYCFNGEPKLIKVQSRYYIKNIKMYHYYDLNWNITDIETKLSSNIKLSIQFPKPKYLNLMIEYAKKFSQYYAFVRVDLYEFNDTVYLSELTFTPANAYTPYKDKNQRIYLGNLLDISKVITNTSFNKFDN